MNRYAKLIVAVFAAISLVLAFATSGEPVIQVLKGSWLEPVLTKFSWPNSIAFGLSMGFLVSTFFWYFVVYLPERARRRILRENLRRSYKWFREGVIKILLWSSDEGANSEEIERLSDYREFREYFREDQSRRWYAVLNGLQNNELRLAEMLQELEMFATEIDYALNSVMIEDQRIHDVLKLLKINIYRLNNWDADRYDLIKSLGGFLWGVFAQWDFALGEVDNDIIQDTIERL